MAETNELIPEARDALSFLAGRDTVDIGVTVTNQAADNLMLYTGGYTILRGVVRKLICTTASPGVCWVSLERAKA